jgi:hypothetical protein
MQDGKETTVKEPQSGKATLQAINEIEHLMVDETAYVVDFFAEGAKAYWRLWGPLGEPMVYAVEGWAKMQRAYFQSLHQVVGSNRQQKSQPVGGRR